MYRMLYYPFVMPPRPVLLQALLYWDELSSIVPMSQGIRPELKRLGEFYVPVSVDDALGPGALESLVSELRTVLRTVPPDKLRPDRGPITGGNRLYFGKLPDVIETELRESEAVVEADGILKGSPEFLLPMLAVTAKHMATASNRASAERVTVTNTDAAGAYNDAYDGRALEVERCWLVEVGRLLPIPTNDVSIEEVIRFRKESTEQRENLTRTVRELLGQLQHNYGEPYVQIELRRSLIKAVAEYADARRKRQWSWVSISAGVMVGLGVAAATAFAPPVGAAALTGLSELGFLLGGKNVRKGPDPNFTYLYNLNKRFNVFEQA